MYKVYTVKCICGVLCAEPCTVNCFSTLCRFNFENDILIVRYFLLTINYLQTLQPFQSQASIFNDWTKKVFGAIGMVFPMNQFSDMTYNLSTDKLLEMSVSLYFLTVKKLCLGRKGLCSFTYSHPCTFAIKCPAAGIY